MPLTRDKIVGHERLAFAFLMLNGNEPIECRISEAAMDALAGERGRQTIARRAQFLAHRDAIEQIASLGPELKCALTAGVSAVAGEAETGLRPLDRRF